MSKKIGSKLADSVRQKRASLRGETAAPEARPVSPSPKVPASAQQAGQRAAQEPSASHGVLHPARIWPD